MGVSTQNALLKASKMRGSRPLKSVSSQKKSLYKYLYNIAIAAVTKHQTRVQKKKIYLPIVLEVKSLMRQWAEIKLSARLVPSGGAKRESISSPIPVSCGHKHLLAHSPFSIFNVNSIASYNLPLIPTFLASSYVL